MQPRDHPPPANGNNGGNGGGGGGGRTPVQDASLMLAQAQPEEGSHGPTGLGGGSSVGRGGGGARGGGGRGVAFMGCAAMRADATPGGGSEGLLGEFVTATAYAEQQRVEYGYLVGEEEEPMMEEEHELLPGGDEDGGTAGEGEEEEEPALEEEQEQEEEEGEAPPPDLIDEAANSYAEIKDKFETAMDAVSFPLWVFGGLRNGRRPPPLPPPPSHRPPPLLPSQKTKNPQHKKQIQELEDVGARQLESVMAGWRAEMCKLRESAAEERRSAEARWLALSREASEARAWNNAAVEGTRWYWEPEQGPGQGQGQDGAAAGGQSCGGAAGGGGHDGA
jgi:hypothetical protein